MNLSSRCGLRVVLVLFFTLALCGHLAEGAVNNATDRMLCDCMEYWRCILNNGVARGMCPMSSDFCCFVAGNSGVLLKPLDQLSILPSSFADANSQPPRGCGEKLEDSREDGIAQMYEWPWHTALLEQSGDLYVCGASLVNERWLLTAAHCVNSYRSSDGGIEGKLKARLGEYDVTRVTEFIPHQEISVNTILVHPLFDNSTLLNDIALLQLASPAIFSQAVKPVCLPDESRLRATSDPGQVACVVTGWGRHNETTVHATVLKEIVLPMWELDYCERALRTQFGPRYRLPSSALCAGDEEQDACDGDGGGPLVCRHGNVWVQHGVVSFGIGCGRAGVPGVYTRVSVFADWLRRVTQLS